MGPIEHKVTAIRQKTSECMQTSATQVLSFFDPSVTVEQVVASVPVHVENGEKVGTSPGHLVSYFAQQGYQTTSYIFDTELFDRSWENLSPEEVITALKERQPHIPDNAWLKKYHRILVSGWEVYAQAGGTFVFKPLSVKLMRQLLDNGPYLMMVNSTYLNQKPKQHYNKTTDTFDSDPIRGRSLTHGVTCAGYKDDRFLIVDPDPPEGIEQHRWIAQDHLIASIMAAQTESDNFLTSIVKK